MNLVAAALTIALSVLSGTTTRTDFTAAGGTDFAFTWKYADSTQVQVYKNNVLQGAGYVVNPAGAKGADGLYAGGTVVFTPAPTAGTAVRIQRTLPLTQTSVWTPYAAFKAKTLEGQLDALAMKDQQIQRNVDDLTVAAGTPDVPCNDAGLCSVGLTAPTFTGALVGNASTATTTPAVRHGSAVLTFGAIPGNSCGQASIPVTGAIAGAPCAMGEPVPALVGTLVARCYVTSSTVVTFHYCNTSASPITPPAETTYRVAVFNP